MAAQPALASSVGESNHSPRWNVWTGEVAGFVLASGRGAALCTTGAGPLPGATMKVAMLNLPKNVPSPRPWPSVSMSP
jgi:hypothetical protein